MITKPGFWPEGKRFAFTIVDDTDCATVENVKPVYDLFLQNGLLTTKTVWPLAPTATPITGGHTLEHPDYLGWVKTLQAEGVEIAYHGATDHSSSRQRIVESLDKFKEFIGHDPRIYASHVGQRESMYWGAARLDGLPRAIFQVLNRLAQRDVRCFGEIAGHSCFWGDVCSSRITYTRGFTTKNVNTLKVDSQMPYHDERRPYVRYWFSSSDGARVSDFVNLISIDHQDQLMSEGGACIVYTHLGNGFVYNGRVEPAFKVLVERLANLPGWFVPASTLLDYLRSRPDWRSECDLRLNRQLQWRWIGENLGPSQWRRLIKRFRRCREKASRT